MDAEVLIEFIARRADESGRCPAPPIQSKGVSFGAW